MINRSSLGRLAAFVVAGSVVASASFSLVVQTASAQTASALSADPTPVVAPAPLAPPAPSAPVSPAPVSPAPAPPAPASPAPVPVAVEIAPHRAIYKMSMSSARRNSPVVGVQGKMLFQWGDACDGWTIEQQFRLNFIYAEGDVMRMRSGTVTWESKDGRRYRFNVRKLVNDELDEEFQGDASAPTGDRDGVARFVEPEINEMPLKSGTLFPTAHTLALLERAMAGDVFFSRTVFDGSDAENATEINAVIGGRIKGPTLLPNIAPALNSGEAWPIRLAFFPLKSGKEQPEYELSMILLSNGIAQSMRIDYGDFSVEAVLENLEALPRPRC